MRIENREETNDVFEVYGATKRVNLKTDDEGYKYNINEALSVMYQQNADFKNAANFDKFYEALLSLKAGEAMNVDNYIENKTGKATRDADGNGLTISTDDKETPEIEN